MVNNKHFNIILPVLLFVSIVFSGCGTLLVRPAEIVPDGLYTIPAKQPYTSARNGKAEPHISDSSKNVLLYTSNDTIFITASDSTRPFRDPVNYIWPFSSSAQQVSLVEHSYDLDVFTTPFKLRFASGGIPAQMTTAFNASLYAGYRADLYTIRRYRSRVAVPLSKAGRIAFGIGAFGGLGSALIKPEYVRNAITYEYEAVTFNYGIAVLLGFSKLNTGIAAGFDHLADANRNSWIYQDKPWLGIFIGLNLN